MFQATELKFQKIKTSCKYTMQILAISYPGHIESKAWQFPNPVPPQVSCWIVLQFDLFRLPGGVLGISCLLTAFIAESLFVTAAVLLVKYKVWYYD